MGYDSQSSGSALDSWRLLKQWPVAELPIAMDEREIVMACLRYLKHTPDASVYI
jgi:hypothetical protein